MTYIALPSAGAGRTAMELAEATRQPVATVRAHLRKLHRARRGADRVADHDGHRPRRWRRGRANPAAVVPARAMGLLRRQRTRYDAERAQYLRDWDRRRSSL